MIDVAFWERQVNGVPTHGIVYLMSNPKERFGEIENQSPEFAGSEDHEAHF